MMNICNFLNEQYNENEKILLHQLFIKLAFIRGGPFVCKIGIVANYSGFEAFARQVAEELNQKIAVRIGNLEDGITAAQQLINEEKVDVLIARGHTGDLIRAHVDIPVIVIENTNFDLATALHSASCSGGAIGFLDYNRDKTTYDLAVVCRLLNLDVKHFSFSKLSETEGIVKRAAESGISVLVGTGSCVVRQAEENGMIGILLRTSHYDFADALKRAKMAYEIKKKEIDKARWLKTVFDNFYQGIMSVAEDGTISVFNQAMEKILDVKEQDVLHRKIEEIVRLHDSVAAVFGDGREIIGDVLQVGETSIAVNRFVLKVDEDFRGLLINVQKTKQIQDLEGRVRKTLYSKGLVAKSQFSDIVGVSSCISKLRDQATKFAKSKAHILICGASGTGKELFAQSIHNASSCCKGPFLAVNCASLPDNLLESELFGYEEGAFTGARRGGKPGLFEIAHGGTIFLDEIGEMSVALQSRLLRVIQEREVLRLGGDRVIPVDVRIICATNRDLTQRIKAEAFREDLYYRINVLRLTIPALRERPEDIPPISKFLIRKHANKNGKRIELADEDLDCLKRYAWPGNVRELEAFIERFVILCDKERDDKEVFRQQERQLGGQYLNRQQAEVNQELNTLHVNIGTMSEIELQIMMQLSQRLNGDRDEMAKILNVSKTTLWRRFKKIDFNLQ